MTKKASILVVACAALALGVTGGCGDDDGPDGAGGSGGRQNPEQTGSECQVADDCYPGVADHTTIQGTVECLDKVRDGYCTHRCTTDADCCAVDGECDTDLAQVCSPYASDKDVHRCFLSCEDPDVPAGLDPNEYCQREVSPDFNCTSSGGGSLNRKICQPAGCGVGASCVGDADCGPNFTCFTEFNGGYCGQNACNLDTDCPQNSRCVALAGGNYCLRTCANEWDCSECRGFDLATSCRDDVNFADPNTTGGTVCVP